MRTWTQNRRSTPGALWLCGAIAAAGLLSARFLSSLPAELTPGSGDAHETSLRATIEPARRFNLTAEYPGSVSETRVSAGSQVQKGEILLILENREISGQIETARKRLEVATARLRSVSTAFLLKKASTSSATRVKR